jgi:hypothetical protein
MCSVTFGHVSYDTIEPNASDAWDLGTSSLLWRWIYGDDVIANNKLAIGTTSLGTYAMLYIEASPIDVSTAWLGSYIYAEHDGTAATNYGDNHTMLAYEYYMNALDGEVGSVYGLDYDLAINEGQIGNSSNAREFVGLEQSLWVGDGATDVNIWGDVYGWNSVIQTRSDANITDDIFGIYNELNLDSGTTIGDDVYGYYGRIDDDAGATGTVYLMYLDDDSGVDYCIYQDGTAPTDLGGDLTFHANGSGLAYGSLYAHVGAINVDISTAGQGVYVLVEGLTEGLLNNVTTDSNAFNVGCQGVYKIDWQISADSQGANKTYECDIFLNGVEQSGGSSRRKFGAAGDNGSFSGTALIDVTDTSHDIDLRIKEPGAGAGTDIDLLHVNFNIIQIGGT